MPSDAVETVNPNRLYSAAGKIFGPGVAAAGEGEAEESVAGDATDDGAVAGWVPDGVVPAALATAAA